MSRTSPYLTGLAFLLCLPTTFTVPQAGAWSTNTAINNPVTTAPGYQALPNSISDGANGVIVAWYDVNTDNGDVYVQRLNASGERVWSPENGILLTPLPGVQLAPSLASDGAGGAIVSWAEERGRVFAQHVAANGVLMWTPGGMQVTAADSQAAQAIVSDAAGGAIIAWRDSRGAPFTSTTRAQRVGANGTIQWSNHPEGVVLNAMANHSDDVVMIPDGTGGAILAWPDADGGIDGGIDAQRLDADGNLLWGPNGVHLSLALHAHANAA